MPKDGVIVHRIRRRNMYLQPSITSLMKASMGRGRGISRENGGISLRIHA